MPRTKMTRIFVLFIKCLLGLFDNKRGLDGRATVIVSEMHVEAVPVGWN
jgi:hypothetical protein